MYFLEEHKRTHQSVFDVCDRDSSGHKIVIRTIYAVSVVVTLPDGRKRCIIYDENMNVIAPIYRYLRLQNGSSGRSLTQNTIERRRTSLRLLVVFCEAYSFKDFYIPELYCNDFIDFLYRGENQSSSAAGYFSDIKLFLKHIGHDKDPILTFSYRNGVVEGADGVLRPILREHSIYAPKTNIDNEKVAPVHNNIKDFKAMQDCLNDVGDITGAIINLLESYLARRIGEVLGLTVEDVASHVNADTGEVTHCLYFRNRLSDSVGQFAKNRSHPTCQRDYSKIDYVREYSLPRNCVWISEELYSLLKKYIETTHSAAAMNHPDNYARAVADIVNPEQFKSDWNLNENHYLFLNSLGGTLTKAAWNKRLHKYYETAGIPLGYGKSINHAWRHMAAYILKHEMHYEDRDIADFLGHRGIGTVNVYAAADYETMGTMYSTLSKYLTGKINTLANE